MECEDGRCGVPLKIYWAAPLFTDSEKAYNAHCTERLEFNGYKVFLPQRDVGEGKNLSLTMEEIKQRDLKGLNACDVVLATLEGESFDPGTVYEVGYAQAMGKSVYILCSDARYVKGDKFNANAMLMGFKHYSGFDQLIKDWLGV